jgi:flagellar hook-associated protein 1
MANLLASLTTLSSGLRAFEKSLSVSQNNVSNVSTPGFARQTASMRALPFDFNGGLLGGVASSGMRSTRDRFAEIAVQRQLSNVGQFQESAALLKSLDGILSVSGDAGIPGGFNALLQSFSNWSAAPQSLTARQQVVRQAEQFAVAVRNVARQIQDVARETEGRLENITARINQLGARIAAINRQRTQAGQDDPSLDASLYTALDELATLADFTMLPGENGQVNVLLGGRTPLTLGQNAYSLQGELAPPASGAGQGGVPQWRFLDTEGRDVTANFSSGQVRGLLDLQNTTLPTLLGGPGQTGSLNEFVAGLAARINGLLTAGQVSTSPPVAGIPLFEFSSSDPLQAASSLQLNQSVPSSEMAQRLASVQTGPPVVANGVALELADLANAANPANRVGGVGFLSFYGSVAASIGAGVQIASDWQNRSEGLLAQAQAIRQDVSGVSLDEEAARILEVQRGYQAISRVVAMIDEMADSLMAMLR